MCLDIAFYSALELIDEYFPGLVHDSEINFDLETGAHFLALGFKKYPIITREGDTYHRKAFEWCIVADYMNTPEKIKAMRPKMANARSEKILDKKSFWYRIRQNRCLIPVTGIYEHREIRGWKNKVPYHVRLKGRKLFCIPGLFYYNPRVPSDPETGEVNGMYSLITRDANPVMRQIHNGGDNAFRMPLFLPKEMELKWLDPAINDKEIEEILSFEISSGEMEYDTVFSIRGRTARPDGQPKNAPFEFQNLPPLGNDDGEMQKALF
jgi:putative SOS response-associated peptidase YedK